MPEMNDDLIELDEVWGLLPHLPLDADSTDLIFVAGAYKGRVMDLLLTKYPKVRVWGFDPQPWAVAEARRRLIDREHDSGQWQIFEVALGREDGIFPMGEFHTDACSFVNTGPGARERGNGLMYEWWAFLDKSEVWRPDWLIANMEGYEFVLYPHLLDTLPTATAAAAHLHGIDKANAAYRLPVNLVTQWHQGFGVDRVIPELLPRMAEHYDLLLNRWPQWTWHRLKG